jgi:hypothetical protein
MEGTKAGAGYLVDIKHPAAPLIRRSCKTLPDDQQNSQEAKFKALGLISESRSIKCEVVGVSGTVTLSSKTLAHVHASGLRTRALADRQTSFQSSESAGRSDSEALDDGSASDAEPVDAMQGHLAHRRPGVYIHWSIPHGLKAHDSVEHFRLL